MTNDEIINQLQGIKYHCQEMYEDEIKNGDASSSIWGKDVKALEMAIKAIEIVNNFETAQIITGGRLNGRTHAYKCGLADGQQLAKTKTATWIYDKSIDGYYCSKCKTCHYKVRTPYCANCGAKMEKGKTK